MNCWRNERHYLRITLLGCLLFPILLLRCDRNPAYHEKLFVYAVLQPGQDRQYVVLDRTFNIQDSITSPGIGGAEVKIWREDALDTLELEPCLVQTANWGWCPAYETPVGYDILPESSYHVQVAWRDSAEGNDFRGELRTTVPGPFRITYPVEGETLHRRSEWYLTWQRSAGASGYCPVLFAPDGTAAANPMTDTAYCCQTPIEHPGWYSLKVYGWNEGMCRMGGLAYPRIDTIGEDVIASYGAQIADSVHFFYAD